MVFGGALSRCDGVLGGDVIGGEVSDLAGIEVTVCVTVCATACFTVALRLVVGDSI